MIITLEEPLPSNQRVVFENTKDATHFHSNLYKENNCNFIETRPKEGFIVST